MSHNARLVRKKHAIAEQETAQKFAPSGTQAPEQGVSAHSDGLALSEPAPATDSRTQGTLNYGYDFSKIRIHPDSPLPGTEDTGNNQMAPPGYVLNPLTQVSSPQNADNAPPPALPWLTRPSPAAPVGSGIMRHENPADTLVGDTAGATSEVIDQETAQKLAPLGTQAPDRGISTLSNGLTHSEPSPALDSRPQGALNYGYDFSKIRIYPASPLPLAPTQKPKQSPTSKPADSEQAKPPQQQGKDDTHLASPPTPPTAPTPSAWINPTVRPPPPIPAGSSNSVADGSVSQSALASEPAGSQIPMLASPAVRDGGTGGPGTALRAPLSASKDTQMVIDRVAATASAARQQLTERLAQYRGRITAQIAEQQHIITAAGARQAQTIKGPSQQHACS